MKKDKAQSLKFLTALCMVEVNQRTLLLFRVLQQNLDQCFGNSHLKASDFFEFVLSFRTRRVTCNG